MHALSKRLYIRLSFLLFISTASFFSCAQDLYTKTIPLPAFTEIAFETVGDLIIEQNSSHSFTITAEPKVVASITATVDKNILRIISTADFNTKKSIKIKVSLPKLNKIALRSSGNILLENWKSDSLDFLVTGSGTIKALAINAGTIQATIAGAGELSISGQSSNLKADIDGAGTIEAGELIASSAITAINGSGDIKLHVTKVLHASVTGSGTITYKGNPKLTSSISGAGEIIKQE